MSSIPGFFSSTDYTNTCPNYSELAPMPYEDFTVPYVYAGGGGGAIASVDAFSSSEKLGFCDGIVPAFSAEYAIANIDVNNNGMESLHGLMIPGNQNLGGQGFSNNNMVNVPRFDSGFDRLGDEYCCATSTFLPEFDPGVNIFAGDQNSLGTQSNQMHGIDQDSNTVKVGRYSEEERKERIERYLKKRNQRNFNKTIKYACRKTLADRRIRVRGRFARNNSDLAFDHNDNNKKEMTKKIIDDVEDPCSKKSDGRETRTVDPSRTTPIRRVCPHQYSRRYVDVGRREPSIHFSHSCFKADPPMAARRTKLNHRRNRPKDAILPRKTFRLCIIPPLSARTTMVLQSFPITKPAKAPSNALDVLDVRVRQRD